jgi:heparanase 1
MDVKLTLCYTLIFLFSISSAEDIKLIVKGVTNIATTDEHFICATLDWWPENKCDYNQCPWGKSGILNLVNLLLRVIHIFILLRFFIQSIYIYNI